jgi:hypothetical protein
VSGGWVSPMPMSNANTKGTHSGTRVNAHAVRAQPWFRSKGQTETRGLYGDFRICQSKQVWASLTNLVFPVEVDKG